VLATRFVIYCLGIVFDAVERRQLSLPFVDADLARPTQRIVAALAWIFCLVVAYPYIPGSSSDAFMGVSVFAGLIISLGSSGLVNQMMSGFVITYSRSLRVGEFVTIGDAQGTVTRIGMLATTVRMPSGEEHDIPNAVVASQVIANYSRPGSRRGVWIGTSVTIGYDTPWRQVHALLLEAAGKTTGLVNDPPPAVRQTALQDFYVEYTLLVSPHQPEQRGAVLAELHAHIQDLFNEHGVQIMSPHYLGDPPEPKVVAKAQWYTTPAKPD
jgi:small-conductance mechanosensitive channel